MRLIILIGCLLPALSLARLSDQTFRKLYEAFIEEERIDTEDAFAKGTAKRMSRHGPHRRWTRASRAVGSKARVLNKLAKADDSDLESTLTRMNELDRQYGVGGSIEGRVDCPAEGEQQSDPGMVCSQRSKGRLMRQRNRRCNSERRSRYRTIDGQCNNLRNGALGATGVECRRLMPPRYADGYSVPTTHGSSGNPLPNPRLISFTLHTDMDKPDNNITNLLMQAGQFLDHDISLTPEEDRECCGDPADRHEDCFPIEVPSSDPFFCDVSPPQTCLTFTRSTPFCSTSKVREQFYIITAFVDSSNIYGSEARTNEFVREFKDGLLTANADIPNFLPTVKEATGQDHFEDVEGTYFSGDIRVNEMPGLATMHTLFFREHNRVAGLLKNALPASRRTDEIIYQEAKRIVSAQWQNVIYGELLPALLGPDIMDQFMLNAGEDSRYIPEVNPTILHEFSTAAFRIGHTLINGLIRKFRNGGQVGSYLLRNNFFESGELIDGGLEEILEGLFHQQAQTFDRFVTEDVTKFLFREKEHDFGQDLVARNIQRSREHGIASYSDIRQICGMPALTDSFDNRPPEIPADTWTRLSQLYSSPRDIELFPAGLSETSLPNAVPGPTFACLIAYQFFLLRHGDRYFFTHSNTQTGRGATSSGGLGTCEDKELIASLRDGTFRRKMSNRVTVAEDRGEEHIHVKVHDEVSRQGKGKGKGNGKGQTGNGNGKGNGKGNGNGNGNGNGRRFPGEFSAAEKSVIRSRSLGDIICDNSNIKQTSRTVFLKISAQNPLIDCAGRPALDVGPFVSSSGR